MYTHLGYLCKFAGFDSNPLGRKLVSLVGLIAHRPKLPFRKFSPSSFLFQLNYRPANMHDCRVKMPLPLWQFLWVLYFLERPETGKVSLANFKNRPTVAVYGQVV